MVHVLDNEDVAVYVPDKKKRQFLIVNLKPPSMKVVIVLLGYARKALMLKISLIL